jgi:hypothetical protein
MVMPRRRIEIAEVSNSASFFALISLIVVFLFIVTYGWSTMLVPVFSLPHDWPDILSPIFTVLRYIAGIAIALGGIILGKAVAAERIRIASEEQPKFTNTWKAYFVVLLVISALGTMNTMFMQTQETGVLTDVISKTRNHLQQLKFKVDEKLSTPAYDQQRADIAQLFGNFDKELRNPANCGFGAQSNLRFRELQAALPKLKPLALGSGACENVGALISAYKDTVDKLTDDLPDPLTKKRFLQKKSFISQIEKTIVDIEEMKVKNVNLSKNAAMPALTTAWNVYAEILNEAELIAGVPFGLPSEINDKNVQGMGNITQIIPLLITQLDNPMTYLIIGAAIFFDVLLIEFFARYLHSQVVIRKETYYTSQPGMNSAKVNNLFEE